MKTKPNILLITTDTSRCDTFGCMGYPYATSPNIDRLAREGVMFMQAHTPSPVCMPARCTLMTGVHTPIHGCVENGIGSLDLPMITDGLKEQGYTNIMIGKTHYGRIPDTFDYALTGNKFDTKDGNCTATYIDNLKRHGYEHSETMPNPVPEELYLDAYLVDRTIEQLEYLKDKDEPFFLFHSVLTPHGPVIPPGKWATLYDDIDLPDINYTPGEAFRIPPHIRMLLGITDDKAREMDEAFAAGKDHPFMKKITAARKLYFGFAAYCDSQLGRIFDYLDASGLRENTLVIFTSDHGQTYYDHGFNNKHNYYDDAWRIPLIMSMPGTLPQGETRDFAIWNDITATILSLAGAPTTFVQGLDLTKALEPGGQSPRNHAVATLYKSMALATSKWKLEYYIEEADGRLFDRVNDPKEQHDLYHDAEYAKVRDALLIALLAWRADIMDLNFTIGTTKAMKGGEVSVRASRHTLAMRGSDSEERLNKAVAAIDSL